ncbi:hypothetical protein Pelo_3346 [Pelomyxa schiedti]|nr:hypothetical protein Pelo_3346 [Pelomyxa schiedti]
MNRVLRVLVVVGIFVVASQLVMADQEFYCGDVEVSIMYRTIDLYNLSEKYSEVVTVVSPLGEYVKVCLPPLTSCGTGISDGDDTGWVCSNFFKCNTTCSKPGYCDNFQCA